MNKLIEKENSIKETEKLIEKCLENLDALINQPKTKNQRK